MTDFTVTGPVEGLNASQFDDAHIEGDIAEMNVVGMDDVHVGGNVETLNVSGTDQINLNGENVTVVQGPAGEDGEDGEDGNTIPFYITSTIQVDRSVGDSAGYKPQRFKLLENENQDANDVASDPQLSIDDLPTLFFLKISPSFLSALPPLLMTKVSDTANIAKFVDINDLGIPDFGSSSEPIYIEMPDGAATVTQFRSYFTAEDLVAGENAFNVKGEDGEDFSLPTYTANAVAEWSSPFTPVWDVEPPQDGSVRFALVVVDTVSPSGLPVKTDMPILIAFTGDLNTGGSIPTEVSQTALPFGWVPVR